MVRSFALASLALLSLACAASPAAGPAAPVAPAPAEPAPAPPSGDPYALNGLVREEPLLRPPALDGVTGDLGEAPAGLAAPPAICEAFVKRQPTPATCGSREAALDLLAGALYVPDPAARDAALYGLEACAELPVGLARALRAELGPLECADALAQPLLKEPPTGLGGEVRTALLGLGYAGRLARTALNAPAPPKSATTTKEVSAFLKGPMAAWMTDQAHAIEALSREGAKLPYYGKALVAVEAGRAEMRIVESARSAPIPKAMAEDKELSEVYYAALDDSLTPRKTRGRDAALVGLGIFAYVGAIDDPRVIGLRKLMGTLYGGRPIDALDRLAFAPLPPAPASPSSAEARLAARLPTYYADLLLPAAVAKDPEVLRLLVDRGVSPSMRESLGSAELPAASKLLFARARLRLAQLYWRAVDVDQAAALAKAALDTEPSDEARLTLAIAIALRDGPENASGLMLRAPLVSLGIGNVRALDALAASGSELGPLAAFDAALVKQVAPPAEASASYWTDVAKRWSDAAARIGDPTLRAYAADHAEAATATAKSIP